MFTVLSAARACTLCEPHLPLGAKPILAADPASRILIIGQAPGRATHRAGIPWADRSGVRLREWLGLSEAEFYDPRRVALLPMGFCFPGSGKAGDLAPRTECAPLWHPQILPLLPEVRLTIYLGRFAVAWYFGSRFADISAAVESFESLLPKQIVLPHPSPRNGPWIQQRP
ncbi:MAG: uracil-DNA glycosylase family protein [Bryobacteraceae bacterium]|nr:uracil-DNA glycosylase family protein [Bryobacteraceae bacterium]